MTTITVQGHTINAITIVKRHIAIAIDMVTMDPAMVTMDVPGIMDIVLIDTGMVTGAHLILFQAFKSIFDILDKEGIPSYTMPGVHHDN